MLLDGRRLLITGVLTEGSIAYSVARRAQEEGAQIVLTGFGRGLRITQRIAKRLGDPAPDVLELDVNDADQLVAVAQISRTRWGALDGILHAIAFAPGDALGGDFLGTPAESAQIAFTTSAYSMKGLAAAMLPLLEKGEHPSIVGLDFDATVAWPAYDWMGVAKAALESVNRYLARDLGASGIRSNLVSAGPVKTIAAGSIPGFELLAQAWDSQAPLEWDTRGCRARRRRLPVFDVRPRPRDHGRDRARRRRLSRARRALVAAGGGGSGDRVAPKGDRPPGNIRRRSRCSVDFAAHSGAKSTDHGRRVTRRDRPR